MRGWLTAKPDAHFGDKVRHICGLYEQAQALEAAGEVVLTSDEMTGVQALERLHPDKPMRSGQPRKREFEYRRHGTLSLIVHREVATGKVVAPFAAATREEEDFATAVVLAICTRPEAVRWHFVVDNLNTHQSEMLVRLVAGLEGKSEQLGRKGQSGILKSMSSRAEYLSNPQHRLVFHYTPKHASWLNQVEMWLSILARKVLRGGSFKSVEELREKVWSFIEYYNLEWAKPFKWTYAGKPLQA